MTKFIALMQRRVVNGAIAGTTLRKQGAAGVVGAVREYLYEVDLSRFVHKTEKRFLDYLDSCTNELKRALPKNAQHWGTARKSLNLLLMLSFYNRYLCDTYSLYAIEHHLEIPLDSDVAKGLTLRAARVDKELPRWNGIKRLQPSESTEFQSCARKLARSMGVARIHLDLIFWRSKTDNENIEY